MGKIRESPIPEISDISILDNETSDRSPILITGAHSIGHLCSPFTSKSVGWFCHLWDTCAQSTLAMIGRGSPGWHFTLFDRCNKVNVIRQLWSQNIWPWARLGRYFVPNKLHSWLGSWSFFCGNWDSISWVGSNDHLGPYLRDFDLLQGRGFNWADLVGFGI